MSGNILDDAKSVMHTSWKFIFLHLGLAALQAESSNSCDYWVEVMQSSKVWREDVMGFENQNASMCLYNNP